MIELNFATRNYRFWNRLRAVFAGASLLLIAAAAAILWSAFSLRSHIADMNQAVGKAETADEQVRPLLAERDRITRDLTAMAVLLESRRFSWTRLFTGIEKAFPTGVALTSVEYNPRTHLLKLDGQAHSPESLRNLMVGLERSPVFREPYLKHQSIEKGHISFHVVAFYQEHKIAGVDPGK
jgi:Tfp pilus assembly protein PilN